MKQQSNVSLRRIAFQFGAILLFLLVATPTLEAQQKRPSKPRSRKSTKAPKPQPALVFTGEPVQERNVRAHLEFLASDALQGRASATQFERIAGQYIAAQFRQFGIEPAGEKDKSGNVTYFQTATLTKRTFAEPPQLSFPGASTPVTWTHGKEVVMYQVADAELSGPFQKLAPDATAKAGAFVFLDSKEGASSQDQYTQVSTALSQGAKAVLLVIGEREQAMWERFSKQSPELPPGNAQAPTIIFVEKSAAETLRQVADGTLLSIKGKVQAGEVKQTWNVVGCLPGSDPKQQAEVILLSAHMDHIGGKYSPDKDTIYNGADDDASGVAAVLELARALGNSPRSKRSVYFVCFGSEEIGGPGARYFLEHPPVPLKNIVANLEFEMIGRPDPKVGPETLWLTGFDLSDLGAELAKQGAHIVMDPHPQEFFFQRSDNYALAKRGVIAHTVSSYGLHADYHKVSDEIEKIDFPHLTRAIHSMIHPVVWLANGSFVPRWFEGKDPSQD